MMDLEAFVHAHESTLHLLIDFVLLPVIVWAVRRVSTLLHNVNKVPLIERRVNLHARVIDEHSSILERSGWTKGEKLERVSEHRRNADFAAEDV